MKTIVNFSGGKDSTAMLLKMLENGEQVDEVIFSDTTAEFPQMYEHINKVEQAAGIKITRLAPKHTFEYYLLDYVRTKGKNKDIFRGYGFPNMRARWCTKALKKGIIDNYLKSKYKPEEIVHCIGYAADEYERAQGKTFWGAISRFPLIEMGMTEKDCLAYCYSRGFDWGGLYEKFDRVSCWCCPNKSLPELRVLWHDYPELWAKLKEWQAKTFRPFRADYTLEGLEMMFKKQ